MPFKIADRTQETTNTTGLGTAFALAGAVAGYQSLVAGVGDGNATSYVVVMGAMWEKWYGTVTNGAPLPTVSRDTWAGSSTGSPVSWPAGTKTLYVCSLEGSRVVADAGGAVDLAGKTLWGGGLHGISIAGNAGTASKLETARTIALSGGVTGSAAFDGSGNVSVVATVSGVATAATADTLAKRDASGDLSTRRFLGQEVSLGHAQAARGTDTIFYSSTDGLVKKNTAAGLRQSLFVPQRDGTDASGTWGISITGTAAVATTAGMATNAAALGGVAASAYLRKDLAAAQEMAGPLYTKGNCIDKVVDAATTLDRYFGYEDSSNRGLRISVTPTNAAAGPKRAVIYLNHRDGSAAKGGYLASYGDLGYVDLVGLASNPADVRLAGSKLVNEASAKAWPGVYGGTDPGNVDFPHGTVLVAYAAVAHARNAAVTITTSLSANYLYRSDGADVAATLTGTWRARGAPYGTANILAQRVA